MGGLYTVFVKIEGSHNEIQLLVPTIFSIFIVLKEKLLIYLSLLFIFFDLVIRGCDYMGPF